jgi:hypothetical protein
LASVAFPVAAIAYQPGRTTSPPGGGGWWLIAPLALIVVAAVLWPLQARRWKRQKLLASLMQALHAEIASALADPVLVHQARRAIVSWRSEDSSRRPGREDEPPPR